jgi:hypothetical protein
VEPVYVTSPTTQQEPTVTTTLQALQGELMLLAIIIAFVVWEIHDTLKTKHLKRENARLTEENMRLRTQLEGPYNPNRSSR